MGQETAHVRVYEEDADALHDLKNRGDSYADVVSRLLDEHSNDSKPEEQPAN
jgi:hypothetical protein